MVFDINFFFYFAFDYLLLICFRNNAFVGRTYLAAIDHNSHVHRKAAVTAEGKPKYNKVYSKRSQNWRVTAVKEPKTYNFWPTIVTRILKKRVTDVDSVLAKVEIPADHPKKLLPQLPSSQFPRQVILSNSRCPGSSLAHMVIAKKMRKWTWNNFLITKGRVIKYRGRAIKI